jgi:DNA-directed RNA polymerase specialized sigma24 family protein
MTETEQERLLQQWERRIGAVAWNLGSRVFASRDDIDDLTQEGRLALLRAAKTARDEATTHYYERIVGAMRHWLRDRYRLIRVPAHVQEAGFAPSACLLASALTEDEKRDPLEGGADTTDAMAELVDLKMTVTRAHLSRCEQYGLATIALGCPDGHFPRKALYEAGARARKKLRSALTAGMEIPK